MNDSTTVRHIKKSLPELLSFIVDNRGKTCPTSPSGMPLIATNCVVGGRRDVVPAKVRYVDDHTYDTWFRAHPEPQDILFVCKGSPGRVAVVPDPVPYCIAQDMVALRADKSVVDPTYLYYRLTSQDVQQQIRGLHVGSLIPHFKKGDFKHLSFAIHEDLDEQRRVAGVLRAIDDVIDHNDFLAKKIDLLWRAQIAAATEERRSVQPLSSLATFINGKNFTKDADGIGRPVIRTPEVRVGPGQATVRSSVDASEEHEASAGDVLFVWSGSLMVSRWAWEPGLINQHIFKVVPVEGVPAWLAMWAIEELMSEFLGVAADKATTMGHIKRSDLDRQVGLPSRKTWSELNALIEPFWDAAIAMRVEANELRSVRDSLLPLLMSGKVLVRDVEGLVA